MIYTFVRVQAVVRPGDKFGEIGIVMMKPGEEVGMHSHTSDIVHTVVAGRLMYSFKKDDIVEEVEVVAPGSMLVEAKAMYAVRNIGDEPAHATMTHNGGWYWMTYE
jgi:mannose-6-phosphate isomerase-like protein (cupin superfamily)